MPEPQKELLRAEGLTKVFPTGRRDQAVHAVSGVDLTIYEGETLALVGESGCGKSTLGRTLIRMLPATAGKVYFHGQDIAAMKDKDFRPLRRRLQMVFQDPYASLDPRMTVRDIIAEPLETYHVCANRQATTARVLELMQAVNSCTATRTSFPAGSASASALRGPSRCSRSSLSAMSRSRRWMSRCRARCSTCSRTCRRSWG